MKFNEFLNKYNNKHVDYDNAYGGQCVDLFRMYAKEVLEISQPRGVVGAKDFWKNYESDPNLYNNFVRIKNTLSFVPKKGDVAIWYNGAYGHIAICTGKGDTKFFEVFEQNKPLESVCHIQRENYNGFYGVLRPRNQTNLNESFNVIVDKSRAMVRSNPNSNSYLAGSRELKKGDIFVATDLVIGEDVYGNNKWYKSAKGNYVWSGGLRRI